jgi:hypothetical protein
VTGRAIATETRHGTQLATNPTVWLARCDLCLRGGSNRLYARREDAHPRSVGDQRRRKSWMNGPTMPLTARYGVIWQNRRVLENGSMTSMVGPPGESATDVSARTAGRIQPTP